VEGVDPRGTVVWEADAAFAVGTGRTDIAFAFAEVVDHLGTLPDASRGCVVLTGCIDRADLAGKVDLVDEARRVVAPGGTLVLLVTDQAAWDEALDPAVRDLLPGRPLHPEAWRTVLTHRRAPDAQWLRPSSGSVHAVVVEVLR
jgi:SAM-dependent methyltransferase